MAEARSFVLPFIVTLFGVGIIAYLGYLGHTVNTVRPAPHHI